VLYLEEDEVFFLLGVAMSSFLFSPELALADVDVTMFADEECDLYHLNLKYLVGKNMFKIVVIRFEEDEQPLHMLRCENIIG